MASDELSIEDFRAAVDWLNYEQSLRETNRDAPSDPQYFADLIRGCLKCGYTLPVESTLFRSRIMPPEQQTDTEPFGVTEMGAPPRELASAGRLNPEGVSFLYSALEENTAVAEVRPWIMARLSVAKFLTTESIDVLDLTGTRVDFDLPPSVRFAAYMISRPVHRDDASAYLGTQYLAQGLRSKGVKGLLYSSLLNPGGANLALFAEHRLTGVSVALHEVRSVTYDTSLLETRKA